MDFTSINMTSWGPVPPDDDSDSGVPMTTEERVEAKILILCSADLDSSIWNPANPKGRCYDPRLGLPAPKPRMSVAECISKVNALVSSKNKLNPLAPTFDGSRSPPSDAKLQPTVRVASKCSSVDSMETQGRWAKYLSSDRKASSIQTASTTPQSHVVKNKSAPSTAKPQVTILAPSPVIKVSKAEPPTNSAMATFAVIEPSSAAPKAGVDSPDIQDQWAKLLGISTPSARTIAVPSVVEVKPTVLIAPRQLPKPTHIDEIKAATSIDEPSTSETSSIIEATPIVAHTEIHTPMVSPPAQPAKASPSPSNPKSMDDNIQNVWASWLIGRNKPSKSLRVVSRAPVIAKDEVAIDSPPTALAGQIEVQGSANSAPAVEISTSLLPEPVPAAAVPEFRTPITPPTGSKNAVTMARSPEVAALDAASAAFANMLITKNRPASSFNRDAYGKNSFGISTSQARANGSNGPSSSPRSNKSSASGNKKKVYSPPKPKAFRHPLDNPVFKIKEDSSAFIAHIKNTIRPGKVYTAIKKENVGSVDNGASQPSGDTPVTGLDDDFTILKSNRHASPLEKPIQTAQAVTQSATIRQGLASGLRVIPAFKSNLPNLDPVATESKASAELDIQVMQKSLPKNAGAWGFHSELVEILTDATKYAEYLGALTEEGTSAITDFPSNHDTFDNDNVSNDGVADIRAVESKNDQEELQDWDGSWNPAPVDWENGRPFDDSFVPEFIRVWAQENPYGPSVTVDRDAKEFILGNHPISNGAFCAPIDQPESIPDTINSKSEEKRLSQTSQYSADIFNSKTAKEAERKASWRRAQELRYEEIERQYIDGSPNPFAPEVDMYVRPAELKDAVAIRDIYNHYIRSTIITEDQTEITLDVAENLIQYSKNQKLPLIVAIQGKLPPIKNVQGRRQQQQPQKTVLPEHETVIGFAGTERSGFGITGSPHGLHRFTIDLKLYVDINYTRKGVGRNLLDHLIHTLYFGYAFKNGCRFINQNNDPVYECGGSGKWHIMNFRIPALKSNDPTLPWVTQWLKNRFMFLPGGVLHSWGRTAVCQGPARFVDLHIIQCEAVQDGDIDCYY